MLCRRCRRQVPRGVPACGCCGIPASADALAYELVLPDRTRLPVVGQVSIGRGPANTVRLDDPSVSRRHARIVQLGDGPLVEDLGSRNGTLVDGRPVAQALLLDGSRVRVGDSELVVERLRDRREPGRTLIVRPGATVAVGGAAPGHSNAPVPRSAARPRLRSGWALKRLEEGGFVLKDLRSGAFVRLDEQDAALLALLDGRRSIEQLALDAEQTCGRDGPARLVALLADLADRGLLHGAEGRAQDTRKGVLARLVAPREWVWQRAGAALDSLYSGGGWVVFSRPALALAGIVALAGLVAFAYLLVSGGRTPFVVAGHLTVGTAAFLLGRTLAAALHELAHGLTITSFGRRLSRAGGKLVLVYPYLFVDTSDAWFESRRRRIAIAAAGPASDVVVGGACALVAVFAGGAAGDAAFQFAIGAFVGTLFTLNPLDERDGYHMLADALRQPGLRSRARRQLGAVLSGRPRPADGSRVLTLYGAAVAAWSLVAAALAVAAADGYRSELATHMPEPVVWALLAALYACLLVPPLLTVAGPLRARWRFLTPIPTAHNRPAGDP
jgi:putative peptide zinc metalloprotease protein